MSSTRKSSRSPKSQAARASAEYGQTRRTRVSPETQEMIDLSNEYIDISMQLMQKIANKITTIKESKRTSPQTVKTTNTLFKRFVRLNDDINLLEDAVNNFKRESLANIPKFRRTTALHTVRERNFREQRRNLEDIQEEENPFRGAGTILRPASPRSSSSPK